MDEAELELDGDWLGDDVDESEEDADEALDEYALELDEDERTALLHALTAMPPTVTSCGLLRSSGTKTSSTFTAYSSTRTTSGLSLRRTLRDFSFVVSPLASIVYTTILFTLSGESTLTEWI